MDRKGSPKSNIQMHTGCAWEKWVTMLKKKLEKIDFFAYVSPRLPISRISSEKEKNLSRKFCIFREKNNFLAHDNLELERVVLYMVTLKRKMAVLYMKTLERKMAVLYIITLYAQDSSIFT